MVKHNEIKVLFLPLNIASIPNNTTVALNKIEGFKAVCITNSVSPIQSRGSGTLFIPKKYPRRKPLRWLFYKLTYRLRIRKWIRWADVVHYTWGPAFDNADDLLLVKKLKKPVFVEWVGSDIRDHTYLSSINRFYKAVFNNQYEYFELESSDHSKKVQLQFSQAGAKPLMNPEMSLFLNKTLFPLGSVRVMTRINLHDFIPNYPDPTKEKVLIIHSPSARVCKGTVHVLKAVEALKSQYEFDFVLIENMQRERALELMSRCDIFIDQLILGSYGLASVEAMGFGKPVICYLMPEVFQAGLPVDCPIVNATPENVESRLQELLTNAAARNEIGKKSRAFVEKYHDADKIASQLVGLYRASLHEN